MRKFFIVIVAVLLVSAAQSCSSYRNLTDTPHERSGIDAVGRPAVQDKFAGISFGMKHPLVLGKLTRQFRGNLFDLGKDNGIIVNGFEFAGYIFNATFYTNKRQGFYRLILEAIFKTDSDRDLVYNHFLDLLKEKYGEMIIVEEKTAYYRDLNDRSVLLSRSRFCKITLTYSDGTLSDLIRKKYLNEI